MPGSTATSGQDVAAKAQEVLFAEAAKLLQGANLKTLHLSEVSEEGCLKELGSDKGWLISAVASASDQKYALVDSGATNALRPAEPGELDSSRS